MQVLDNQRLRKWLIVKHLQLFEFGQGWCTTSIRDIWVKVKFYLQMQFGQRPVPYPPRFIGGSA